MKAFIIFRDRVTYTTLCCQALIAAGLDVVIVDQGTSYKPAVAWLDALEAHGGVQVLRKGGGHPRQLWDWAPFLSMIGSDRYVVTDCDVVPSEDCPLDWPDRLSGLLDEYPDYDKAGLGLRLDRIPETYQRRDHVLAWEQKFWDEPVTENVYRAPVDTTLALYRPWTERPVFTLNAMRTGYPYVADHVSWYEDYRVLDKELRWYHEHAEPGISHWTVEGRSVWGT
jgi:hypothetical protein